jgi:MFS family permease
MYAFRKPFQAAQYEGLSFLGTQVELKTALVIGQIVGYALSKVIGIKVCTEATRSRRRWMLVGLICAAQAALALFAIVPNDWKVLALFLNGLPLGMVWGLVVWYLEGRRTSEFLLAGLSCSCILASGAVKDVGRALMAGDPIPVFHFGRLPNFLPVVSEFWMPFATGCVFFPPFLLATALLDQLPDPDSQDVALRTERKPMNRDERWAFFRQLAPGIVLVLAAYFFLTAYRDFRDAYMVEIYDALDYPYAQHKTIISRSETFVAFGVICILGTLFVIRDNILGLIGVFAVIGGGIASLGVGTYLLERGMISGFWWMTLTGLGAYLAYVPFGTVLFDRLMASTRTAGTAVFAIYLADATGYVGSIAVQLHKDFSASDMSRLDFLKTCSYALAIFGSICVLLGGAYFVRVSQRIRRTERQQAAEAVGLEPVAAS